MRIVFAGTPEFAAAPLTALLDAGQEIVAVYSQPDRPAGRGRRLAASPVKQVAEAAGLPVEQPTTLKKAAARERLAAYAPELMVVIAYGLILPPEVLAVPALGCVNLHASLLPRWRGAAPIQRAIEAGDAESGLCLMQMEAGLDTGPVLARAVQPIAPNWTAGDLHAALIELACRQLPGWVEQLAAGELTPEPQDEATACYARKLSKAEAAIDWREEAALIERRVRAFNPWPVATGRLDGEPVKLWRAAALPEDTGEPPGRIVSLPDGGLAVACGQGALRLDELQFPGARRLAAAEAARGRPLAGRRFQEHG